MDVNKIQIDMKVKTHARLGATRGMLVRQDHLTARQPDAEGTVAGPVPGHGGDVWYVRHGEEIGVYCFDEFDPIPQQGRQ